MEAPLFFDLFEDSSPLSLPMLAELDAQRGKLVVRHFPDGESYLRVESDCVGRRAVVLADLHEPNRKLLTTLLLAATLRDLGVAEIILVAPYLAYMRQDERFVPGEAVTSRYIAALLSNSVDALVTVDPHLHRIASLEDIYTIPTYCVASAPAVAEWLGEQVERPLLVGPDEESAQWVEAIAACGSMPFVILEKERHGDREVSVSTPEIEGYDDHTPVLVDDIISTGHTMLSTIQKLFAAGFEAPVCVGVHGVFAEDALGKLRRAGAQQVVTCNTIPHMSNAIDIGPILAEETAAFLQDL